MWQEEFDVFLATGKDLVVNGLLKEQGIKILLVTGSLRNMVNMSVISLIRIILLEVVSYLHKQSKY